jgi:glutamate--cysteine ligase
VNAMGDTEAGFLEPLRRIVASGNSPAHDLLERYKSAWDGSLDPLYDELSF